MASLMTFPQPQWIECMPGVWDRVLFSPEHKVDCHWHVVIEEDRWTVVDPFEPWDTAAPWNHSIHKQGEGRVLLTNQNHQRASESWQRTLSLPTWDAATPPSYLKGWEVFPLPGGAVGEVAARPLGARYWILGDALVHLPGRGLEMLPAKYCTDPTLLPKSLKMLMETEFDSLLFAHGSPILSDAKARLERLLTT